jgi:hypothetical protein
VNQEALLLSMQKKERDSTPGAKGTHNVISIKMKLDFLFILLIYICCINHLGCVVSNNETRLQMTNREGCGNDCGLFYAMPRSALRKHPLKISG